MKILLLFFTVILHLTALSQDTLKQSESISYQEYLKNKSVKYSGKQYPDFKITLPDSSTFSNRDLQNKTTFINFWIETCAPCMAEMEGLNALYGKLEANPDFAFVSFTFEPDSIITKQIIKQN